MGSKDNKVKTERRCKKCGKRLLNDKDWLCPRCFNDTKDGTVKLLKTGGGIALTVGGIVVNAVIKQKIK